MAKWGFPFAVVPTVRILVVCDTRDGLAAGGYDFTQTQSAFDLKLALDAVSTAPFPWARFQFLTAHRDSPQSIDPFGGPAAATAQFPNFRFDALPAGVDLAQVEQVWLFGFGASQDQTHATPALGAAELMVLHQFMDRGGGVFAAGDHETLGDLLCGSVKRVREMRTWTRYMGGLPQPPVAGTARHDTLRDNPPGSNNYSFDNQADAFPQPLRLKRYAMGYAPANMALPKARQRPHPLLCGLGGPIDVLPDHMHEGEVVQPNITPGAADWPGGVRPEVIAWSEVIAHEDASSGPVNGTSYGAIGAYDGHEAGVGRIVVDATWHHWVHVNLQGFLATGTQAGNPAALAKIHDYYRNVAVWLSPPHLLTRMADAAFIQALLAGGLTEGGPVGKLGTYELGLDAIDVLGRSASPCNLEYFVFQRPGLPLWLAPPHYYGPDPGSWMDWPILEYCAGAQLKAAAARLASGRCGLAQPVEEVRRALHEAVRRGLAEMAEREAPRLRRSHDALQELRYRLGPQDEPGWNSRAAEEGWLPRDLDRNEGELSD